MQLRSIHFPPMSTLACGASLVACGGEIVDLGRNYEAGVAGTDGSVVVQPGVEGDAGGFLAAIASIPSGPVCAGSCVELEAVVSGGTGPFSYAWGEGLGEGSMTRVCPGVTTMYEVRVSSLTSSQQSLASAVVVVVPCDAGVVTQPPHDAGATQVADSGTTQGSSSALCIMNPSFEGTPTIGTPGTPPGTNATAAPPGWQVCQGDPDIDPSVSGMLPANEGMTYIGLWVGSGSLSYLTEAIGTTLCAPLQAGVRYSFCLDLAIGVRGVNLGGNPLMPSAGGPAPVLDMFGGITPCGEDEPLFISQAITNVDSWSKVCSTFVPTRTLSTLTLVPSLGSTSMTSPPGASYVIVDHITSP